MLGILHSRNVAQRGLVHQKQLVKAFNQHETEQGSAVIGGDEQALKRR